MTSKRMVLIALASTTSMLIATPATATTSWPQPAVGPNLVVPADEDWILDVVTGSLNTPGGTFSLTPSHYDFNGNHARSVFDLNALTIGAGGSLTLRGNRTPEFRVAGDVSIAGTLDLRPAGLLAAVGHCPASVCTPAQGGQAAGDGLTSPGAAGGPSEGGYPAANGGGGGGGGPSGGGGGAAECSSGCAGGNGGGVGGLGGTAASLGGGTVVADHGSTAGQPGSLYGGGGGGSIGAALATERGVWDTLYPGSGGGGGTAEICMHESCVGGRGGWGGGAAAVIASGAITVTGSINADGSAGDPAAFSPGSGGGGGSGGSIVLAAPSITLGAASEVTARGGPGGLGLNGGGQGGTGGWGRIRLAADSLSVQVGANTVPTIGTNQVGEAYVTRFTPVFGLSPTPTSVTAGQTSAAITITVTDNDGDGYSAPPAGTLVYLSSSSPTGTFVDGDGAAITSVTIPEGSDTATFRYRDSTGGSPTLTASDDTDPTDTGILDAERTITVVKAVVGSSTTLAHKASPHVFKGKVSSASSACRSSRKIEIRKVGGSIVARATTKSDGTYRVAHNKGRRGRYVAKAVRRSTASVICKVSTSSPLRVRR